MSITLTHKTTQIIETHEVIQHHDWIMRLHDQILVYGPHHFNMQTWCEVADNTSDHDDDDRYGKQSLEDIVNHDLNLAHCGTTACLAGHAVSFMHRNGAIDLIKHSWRGDSPYVSIDNTKLANLMGVKGGSFSSEVYEWHHITQAAYRNDLAIAGVGCVALYHTGTWFDTDDSDPKPLTMEMLTGDDDDNHRISHVRDDKGFITPWDEWHANTKHHAEWVAILTYLRWIVDVSNNLYWQNTLDHVSIVDQDRITNSPAFESYYDQQERDNRYSEQVKADMDDYTETYGMETPGRDTTTILATDDDEVG